MAFKYPEPRRDDSVFDHYHGVKVRDPYRWMENPDSAETQQFVKAQNDITMPYLASCTHRQAINDRLTNLWNFEKYSCPEQHGNKYFYYRNTGLQNQNVMCVQETLDSPSRVFFDPNTLSADGTVSLSQTAFSENGAYLAYALSTSGSDWTTIHIMEVASGKKLPEVLEKVKFSPITWTHDNKGLFYACYPDANNAVGSDPTTVENQKLFYHRVNTLQSEDVLTVEFPEDPQMRINAEVSNNGRWLILTPRKGCRSNLLYFNDLELNGEITGLLLLVQLVYEMAWDYDYVTTEGSVNVFRTNKEAPNYRLISIDFENKDVAWKVVVPEDKRDVIDWASPVNQDQLVVCYIHNVVSTLSLFSISGHKLMEFPVPMGSLTGFSGKKKYSEIFYKFTSFLIPGIIYQCELTDMPATPVVHREMVLPGCDLSTHTVKQIFYASKDRVLIPMFIVYEKNMTQDGTHPCLLYGYGGFNISVQPTFSVTRLVFMQNLKGTLAIANIRGGGEYGENWHNAGRQTNKQNCFDDFQSAAEFLISEKYTSRELLVIQGGSNGGLLVAACINQRPELFGAAIIQVGVLDMLRYHNFTIGYAWSTDYGTSDIPGMFKYLMSYSPLHNIFIPGIGGKEQYPATLLLTADHDDRVVPMHSLKFISELHYNVSKSSVQRNPLLVRIECKAGHGSGKPTTKLINEATDILCFIVLSLRIKFVPSKT